MTAMFEASDKRFEVIEKRFETIQREMSIRFESLEKRLAFTQWFIGIGFALMTAAMTILKIYAK
jgi:hypothetical protein